MARKHTPSNIQLLPTIKSSPVQVMQLSRTIRPPGAAQKDIFFNFLAERLTGAQSSKRQSQHPPQRPNYSPSHTQPRRRSGGSASFNQSSWTPIITPLSAATTSRRLDSSPRKRHCSPQNLSTLIFQITGFDRRFKMDEYRQSGSAPPKCRPTGLPRPCHG